MQFEWLDSIVGDFFEQEMDQTDHRSCGKRSLANVDIINCVVAHDLLPSLLKSARLPQETLSLTYHT